MGSFEGVYKRYSKGSIGTLIIRAVVWWYIML